VSKIRTRVRAESSEELLSWLRLYTLYNEGRTGRIFWEKEDLDGLVEAWRELKRRGVEIPEEDADTVRAIQRWSGRARVRTIGD